LEARARIALEGVGDSRLGEWIEQGSTPNVVHLRRRLSVEEQSGVGPAVDVRGTDEARLRYAAVFRYLPPAFRGDALAAKAREG
jgi:hypothetical protein